MNLSEEFAKSQGKPIEVNGRMVHCIYRRQVQPGMRFTVVRKSQTKALVQGLRLKLDKGTLVVAEKESREMVLWADGSPEQVDVECRVKKLSELRVWNCWRDEAGTMQAWLANAGMLVEETVSQRVLLRCNSRGDLSFDDLVVELIFHPSE